MQKKNTNSGFSLVELMIVVVILGTIAAIAIPQYLGYIENSKRQVALTTLEQFPVLLEGYRADHGKFCPDCSCTTGGNYTDTTAIKNAFPDFRPSNKSSAASPYNYKLEITVDGDCSSTATFTATLTTEGEKQGYPATMPNGTEIKGTYNE